MSARPGIETSRAHRRRSAPSTAPSPARRPAPRPAATDSRSTGWRALCALDHDADRNAHDAGARAHVTASRWRTGRPVTRFCGFKRSSLSPRHRQDQIDRLAAAPSRSRRRDRGRSAGTARPRARRVASSSSSPFHSRSPIRVPSASRPTYQVNFTSRSSVSGSISTSTPSRCAIQRRITSRQRRKPAPAGGQIERHVEQIAALAIVLRIVVRSSRRSRPRPECRASRPAAKPACRRRAGDRFLVGGDQRAFVQGHALRAEEQFGGAQHERILAAVERIAQDHVHELIEEDVRDLRARRARCRDRPLPASGGASGDRGRRSSPASSRAHPHRRSRRSRPARRRGADRPAARRAASSRPRRPPAAARAPAAPDRP